MMKAMMVVVVVVVLGVTGGRVTVGGDGVEVLGEVDEYSCASPPASIDSRSSVMVSPPSSACNTLIRV